MSVFDEDVLAELDAAQAAPIPATTNYVEAEAALALVEILEPLAAAHPRSAAAVHLRQLRTRYVEPIAAARLRRLN